ncbi:MAG: sulfatase [Bacteroidales bacterium]|nr:sulfatase [Bacteroidales bacterium]
MKHSILLIAICSLLSLGNQKTQANPPNILICLSDDQSFPHASAYGCKWVSTPGIDYIAQNGLLFTNAYTPNAKCAPSRATILTGRYSWQLEHAANHMCNFPAKFTTIFEALKGAGYHTGYTGKGWAPGDPGSIDGVKRELTGANFAGKKGTRSTNKISLNNYTENFKDFLDSDKTNKPFVFWYGCTEPHRPYAYGSGVSVAGKKLSDIDSVFSHWPDIDSVRNDLLDYALEIEHYDSHIEKMIALLKERNLLDNTIIIATSDNGMPFPRMKGQAYEYANHMPLAIMWPKGIVKPGRTIEDYVSFVDFVPTILESAGVKESDIGMMPASGISLFDIFKSENEGMVTSYRNYTLVGKERHDVGRPNNQGYPMRGIISDGYLYLTNYEPDRWPVCNPETGYPNCSGSPTKSACLRTRYSENPEESIIWKLNFGKRAMEELYHVSKDKECVTDLINSDSHAEMREKLKHRMESLLKEQGDPRMFGEGHVFEEYPFYPPARQNYYEKFMSGKITKPPKWIRVSDIDASSKQME